MMSRPYREGVIDCDNTNFSIKKRYRGARPGGDKYNCVIDDKLLSKKYRQKNMFGDRMVFLPDHCHVVATEKVRNIRAFKSRSTVLREKPEPGLGFIYDTRG